MDELRVLSDSIGSGRFSTMDAILVQRPGDHFVSVPFNLVVLITLGLISVHSRRLGCLISFIAVGTYLCSTVEQSSVYSDATWREKLSQPCAEVTQLDVSDFLILGLVRWISSLLFAAFVCKAVCRVLPLTDVARILRSKWFIVLPVCVAVFYRGKSELDTLGPVTGDWGIYYHFGSAHLMEGVRAAFQVALLFTSQMLAVSMKREELTRCMAHIFICSCLIITQNILTYEINHYSTIDIALQLLLLMRTLKQFVRYRTEMAQTFMLVGAHLLITFSAMLVAICSAVNLVATQFFRACQQYYIRLWQDERHEPYRPIMETGDRQQGEMVCTCDTIPRYNSFPELEAQNPHVQCGNLALRIAHNNMPVPSQPSHGPILCEPNDEEYPPIQPMPSAIIDDHCVEVETSLKGTLLNGEVQAQCKV